MWMCHLIIFIQQVLQSCSVFGVIEGSDNIEERLRSAKETVIRPVDGIVVTDSYCISCSVTVIVLVVVLLLLY